MVMVEAVLWGFVKLVIVVVVEWLGSYGSNSYGSYR